MRFTTQTSADGVSERHFTLDDIPGVLWSADDDDRPLVLLGHGGGQHKLAPGMVGRARRLVAALGFAAVAIDAPGHGDRPRTEAVERFTARLHAAKTAGEPVAEMVADFNAELAELAVPEWRHVIDALGRESVGYWGLALGTGIGVPLVAAEPRIAAAALGLVGSHRLVEAAGRITVPVEFQAQWDDEMVPRAESLALFEAFGSAEKSLHANSGRHMDAPRFEVDSGVRFFARHLGQLA